jgi:hypothetical protein
MLAEEVSMSARPMSIAGGITRPSGFAAFGGRSDWMEWSGPDRRVVLIDLALVIVVSSCAAGALFLFAEFVAGIAAGG